MRTIGSIYNLSHSDLVSERRLSVSADIATHNREEYIDMDQVHAKINSISLLDFSTYMNFIFSFIIE